MKRARSEEPSPLEVYVKSVDRFRMGKSEILI